MDHREVHAFAATTTAAARSVDASRPSRVGRSGHGVSDAELIEHGEALTELADRRIAHWDAMHPDRLYAIDRNGLLLGPEVNLPSSVACPIPHDHPSRRRP